MVKVDADWAKYGPVAGPIRNQDMLDLHRPKMVIAFPGGKGTADMVKRAKKLRYDGASLDIVEVREHARNPCGDNTEIEKYM